MGVRRENNAATYVERPKNNCKSFVVWDMKIRRGLDGIVNDTGDFCVNQFC